MGHSLAIKVLEVTEYPPSGQGYKTHATRNPTWEEVEAAIRALNHHRLPFIFIGLREECRGEECLSVLDGPKGYAITVADSESGWTQYCDPNHTGGEIAVWTPSAGNSIRRCSGRSDRRQLEFQPTRKKRQRLNPIP